MVAKSADIVLQFCQNIIFKIPGQSVVGAGKHEVLPYHQSQFITGIVEIIAGIKSATPYTNAIKMGIDALFQQIPRSCFAGS